MNITVYCSACDELDEQYQHLAQQLGHWIGSHGHTLVYGGVDAGLMHIVAQATHNSGGYVLGIVPQTFMHRIDPICDEVEYAEDLNDRKGRMMQQGDAFVVLPGGIGTLDEWISTLSQLLVLDDEQRGIIVADLDDLYASMLLQLQRIEQSPVGRGRWLVERQVMVNDAEQMIEELDRLNI